MTNYVLGRRTPLGLAAGAAALLLALPAGGAKADTGAEFFKGKTVKYIVATSPGGGYDFYGRLVAKFMEKNLPGSTFVVVNKPGGGHKIGANLIYNAKPTGLTIGIFNTGLIYSQVIGQKGIKFDLAKMSWIGKAAADPRVIMAAVNGGPKTLAELKGPKTWRFSSSGVGTSGYNDTQMLGKVLGWNYKMILGYRGTQSELAMRRGEIHAAVSSLSSAELFVKNGYGRFLAIIGGKKTKDAPQLIDVVEGKDAKAIAALIGSQAELARFTGGPPAIPEDRLKALRTAYDKSMADDALRAQAAKAGRPIEPLGGEEVRVKVRAALNQPPEVVALVREILNVKAPSNKVLGTKLLSKTPDGRWITFKHGAKTIKAKISGSRTKITVDGQKAKRKALKVGMVCDIDYKPGKRNEPKTMECK
ncbi:MAG: tripartite tricarboxylate transporter substrate-binding protein [Alphaproteobacteria bacterium]|nr:tripartite tricarboxylate transporter substrate-binding protein [Alphaproteobacteria bacterium]